MILRKKFFWGIVVLNFLNPVLTQANQEEQTSVSKTNLLILSIQELSDKTSSMNSRMSMQTAMGLLYRVRGMAADKRPMNERPRAFGGPDSPETRRRCAESFLGSNLYARAETRFLAVLAASTNAEERIAAGQMLGKGLASEKAVAPLAALFRKNVGALENDQAGSPVSLSELFWTSEALCYLGRGDGLEVLSWALETKKATSEEKVVAIKALVTLGTLEAKNMLLQNASSLACSEDSSVTYSIFEALQNVAEFRGVGIHAGKVQLERLERLSEHEELSQENAGVLTEMSFYLTGLQEKKRLSSADQKEIKKVVIKMLLLKRKNGRISLASLFQQLATDEDMVIIQELLKSEWYEVRRLAVFSVLKCSEGARSKLLKDVISVLDDPDVGNRKAAVGVIQVVRGEKPTELRTPEEIETEAKRIKDAWKRQQPATL